MLRFCAFLLAVGGCHAFAPSCPSSYKTASQLKRSSSLSLKMQESSVHAPSTRREALGVLFGGAAWLANAKFASAIAGPEGLEYEVLKAGKGPKPKIGDLVAIRFKGSFNGKEFDNCFNTANSYYYRVGSDSILRGLDLAVQNMRVGDLWKLTVPANLAFGEKGTKASAGKPRIPGGASLEYEVLLETLPGAEEEILELTNGEYPS
uniref:peptidylprolyl isomerase n=1 Tax=Cryptomonas curvata TaxID=233186 RepID=A0A7S0LWQ9_9CRYP|mmetsp:Transcript_10026/g.21442  ORF Transcript_10026/g.21442 Transcript_10026/m.21442 type:complete len:206 (+) Transcript_10026:18-635(+)